MSSTAVRLGSRTAGHVCRGLERKDCKGLYFLSEEEGSQEDGESLEQEEKKAQRKERSLLPALQKEKIPEVKKRERKRE